MLAVALVASTISVAQAPLQTASAVAVGFGKSLLKNETLTNPTSLQFGPDGRLYVAEQAGLVKVLDISRAGTNNYSVQSTETISSIRSITNHNDNGNPNGAVVGRLVTGLLVTGTATRPVVYVTSSDPRAGAFDKGDVNLDTNSGILTRLTWTGSRWNKRDLVRGLPRSEEVHGSNGMSLDVGTNTLLIAQGGHTNEGAPSNLFAQLPEYALSAAVLSVDLDQIGTSTYDLPTLDDPTRSGDPDPNDPFGGNDGRNQARLVGGGPVQVYSPGYRNAYDLVRTQLGRLFVTDNGPGSGQGAPPAGEGPGGDCTNASSEPGSRADDQLHRIKAVGYYGGHPNPTRGNVSNTFGGQSPVPAENPVECDYRTAGSDGALTTFPGSTNGIVEYTAANFDGAMTGDLLTAGWDNLISRIQLNDAGTRFVSKSTLFSSVGTRPLDITTQGGAAAFPGTIWVADHSASNIVVYEPNDFGGGGGSCTGADSPTLDEDEDGYSNADEIDNGTDPCSAGDVPPDADGDLVSDLNDPNDDDDAYPDTTDPFAIDASNGADTTIPTRITWDPTDPSPGGIRQTGFTGLMTNGADYGNLYDGDNMTVGGAFGGLGIDAVPNGTAQGGANSQRFAFQLGIDADPATRGPFTVSTRVLAPFGGQQPEDFQSMGLAVGTGGQDDYVSLALSAGGGTGGIEVVHEVGGVASVTQGALALPGPDYVDLSVRVDPSAQTIRPSYVVTQNGQTGSRIRLARVTVPASWFSAPTGFAAGVIATSAGPAPPFPVTWDFFRIKDAPGAARSGGAPAALPGRWETRAPTGFPRQEVAYVRLGSKFYLAGGSTRHQVYNAKTDTWRNRAPLPQDLDHIPGVAVGGKIYYIGGLLGWPVPHVGTVYIFDPATNTFSQGASMPSARARGAGGAAVYQGKIYYAGGLHDGASVRWFDVYDPATNTWSRLPNMPNARDHFHGAIVDGKFYAIGGRNTVRIGANDVFDFSTGQWTAGLAPLPTLRGGFATAVVGEEILVIGGEGGGATFDDVEAYDPQTNTWRTLAPMPTARHGLQAVVWRGGVYIAAGGTQQGGGGATGVHEVFFPQG